MKPQHDVIIGGGHNGLVASWYLAQAGLDVLVLERRDIVGGACITEELWPGYRVPTFAYFCHLLQPRIVEDMRLAEHGFAVHQVDPAPFVPYPDGRAILNWSDPDKTYESLSAFSARDADAFGRFNGLRRRMAALLHRYLLTDPPTLATLVDSVRGTPDEPLLERLIFGNVADFVDEHFESPEIKGWLVNAWDAGDIDAPGSLLSTAYQWTAMFNPAENRGIVSGGMGGITRAMAAAAQAAGVTIQTGAEVNEVLVEHGAAHGVRLAGGDVVTARKVVSNADPKRTFLRLLAADQVDSAFRARVQRLRTRTAYLKFHAKISALPDFSRHLGEGSDPRALAQIWITPSMDYYRKAWHDAAAGHVPEAPVMSIQIPTVYDGALAPAGEHFLSVWALYAPVTPLEGSWDEVRDKTAQRIIESLSAYAPNMRDIVQDWLLFTPLDIERRTGMTDGNIRHLDMVAGQLLGSRPLSGWAGYRTPIADLYLCGAGTHPGGDVTGAPGHNAARAVLSDLGTALA